MNLTSALARLVAILVFMILLPAAGIGEAEAQDYTNCNSTTLTGNNGTIWCESLEQASTASRNAAHTLNTEWYELGAIDPSTREPYCYSQIRYDAYWLVLCHYRGMFGNDQVWRKAPLSSCLLPGMADPATGLCNVPKCDSGCLPEGGNSSNPITSAGGNKRQVEADYVGSGIFPLRFERTYNSARTLLDTSPLPLGVGWTHSYSGRLVAGTIHGSAVDYIQAYRPNGSVQRFTYNGTHWVTDADLPERLTAVTNGLALVSATYTRSDDSVETYDGAGKLVEITRLDGFKQALSYATTSGTSPYVQAVTDPEGRVLAFGYTGNNLTSVTDPSGRAIQYTYSADDLIEVTYPEGMGSVTRTYHYNESGQTGGISQAHTLTGITDEGGQRYASWGYDNRRRGVLSVHGAYGSGTIDRTSIVFNGNGTSTITDALGKARAYGFSVSHRIARLASLDSHCPTCGNTAAAKTYDANGMSDISTDFAGTTTDQDYDARLLETRRIEAANDTQGRKRTIQTDWYASLRVPTERRTYDATNTLVAKVAWTYNTRGQVLTATQTDPVTAATRTTTTTYCEQSGVTAGTCPRVGLVTSVDGARTDLTDQTTFTYRTSDHASCVASPSSCPYRTGDLWKVTNALGHVTETLAYDGAGRPLSVKDANGIVTEFTYHPRGWMTSRTVKGATVADDRSTLIDYWPTGLVKRVTQSDGSYAQYSYDAAHRLTDIADSAGNTIHYTLDNAGNRTGEHTRDPNGALKRTLSRVHNQLGQLQSQSDAYSQATGFTYDANGNTDVVTDALGRATDNAYDPLNRLTQTIQDIGGISATTQFQYDAQDNLTRVTDPNGLQTNYAYNGFGDLLQLASPDTGITTYAYDSAGNRASQTDARAKAQAYTYDALNRLTKVTNPTRTYTYDNNNTTVCPTNERFAKGRLTGLTDQSGNTKYCYNRFGDLVRKVQTSNGVVLTTRLGYDAAGRLAIQTYPDGAVLDALRDGEGRVIELGVTPNGGSRQIVLTGATYAPFGPSTGWTYGNGRSVLRTLNQNYQPLAIHDAGAGGLSLGFGFDEVGNLTLLQDAAQTVNLAQYGYDTLNRLQQTKDGPTATPIETYGYDATGNRQSVTNAGLTTAYTYPAGSHRLDKVGTIVRTYDASGNTTKIGGSARQFVYDPSGRMTQVKAGSTVTRNYRYNAKGEQTWAYLDTANAYFVYDEAGHLLGEYDNNGVPVQQFLWLGDLPVAVLAGSSANQKLHYVEPDHLGTPRVVIDGTRNVAIWEWKLQGEAFGNTPPNQNPDGDANQFVFNLRYPGQRYDSATGLNYNYFRDYDPTTGRYVESDPIGLKGGISTYVYANSSPLTNTDQLGLRTYLFSIAGGGGVGKKGIGFSSFIMNVSDPVRGTSCQYSVSCFGFGASLWPAEIAIASATPYRWDDGKECSDCSQFSGWGMTGQVTAQVVVGASLANWIQVPNGPFIDSGAGLDSGQIAVSGGINFCYFRR